MKREGDLRAAPRPRCPTCGRPTAWAGNPARPFCSSGCKLIDLGTWLDGRYSVAGAPLPTPDVHPPDDEP